MLVQESAHLGDGLQVPADHDNIVARFQGHGPAMSRGGNRPFRYHRPHGIEFQYMQRMGRDSGFHVRSCHQSGYPDRSVRAG